MLKLDRTGLSKKNSFELSKQKVKAQNIFKNKDIMFFFKFVARHNLREEALKLLNRKLAH